MREVPFIGDLVQYVFSINPGYNKQQYDTVENHPMERHAALPALPRPGGFGRNFGFPEQAGQYILCPFCASVHGIPQQQAMRPYGGDQMFDIVRRHIIPASDEGKGLRCAHQGLRTARADT
jgi:hypothetical protein